MESNPYYQSKNEKHTQKEKKIKRKARPQRKAVKAAFRLQTGPDGGKFRMVRWYESKKRRRRQAETLFGETWHDPRKLKAFKAAQTKKKGRKK